MNRSHFGQLIEQIKIFGCVAERHTADCGICVTLDDAATAQSMKCIGRANGLQVQYVVMHFELINERCVREGRIICGAMGKG
jgi:hypothetical protein